MSASLPYGPSIDIAHQFAAIEAAALQHEFISPDLSINGITKLEYYLSPESMGDVFTDSQLLSIYLGEARQMIRFLHDNGLDPRQIRYALRDRIGKGTHQHPKRGHISRSDAVRAAFERASAIAAENSMPIVMVHHLFATLLEIPETHIRVLLEEQGIDGDDLAKKAATLPMPEPVPIAQNDILSQLGNDLTAKAKRGELGSIIKRKKLETQVIQSLMRQKKNAPLLVGKPGIGKTAIVERLAIRIANGNLSRNIASLASKRIIQIEVSSLIEGTTYRGDLEKRIRALIEAASNDPDVILFIDEIHRAP